ncbi:MAG TPA: isocitrate lyase/phosphoenolpyruvate mutase family protein [Gaiellaceae bacterium]|nr:isocitrate lyase/phosphoenolpyruvate mutase family protein [Gaiellaceae bacterium]
MTQREQAELFRSYHLAPPVLVLPNVWDVATAVIVARTPGARALATTSAGLAWSRGYADGEVIPRDEMLEEVRRIVNAVELPVTADLEGGYGDPGETARLAIDAGAVGLNLEDGTRHEILRPVEEHVESVRAVVAAGEQAGVPLVVNARTDVFLIGAGSAEEQVETAIGRLNAYLEAGADCGFAAGARDAAVIERLTREVRGPVSIFAGPGWPTIAELESLGVARISVATRAATAAYSLVAAIAQELFSTGTYDHLVPAADPQPKLNELLA